MKAKKQRNESAPHEKKSNFYANSSSPVHK